jgi:serine/threonine protein kinase
VQDDLYSLACLSYLLLTGRMPFKAGSAIEARSLRERPKRPSQLTAIQWQTLRQALKFDRADRPMDVAQFIEHLPLSEAAPSLFSPQDLAATPIFGSRLPWRGIAATLSVLALAGFGYWLFQNNEEVLSRLGTPPVEAPAVDEPPAPVKAPAAKGKSNHALSAQPAQTAANPPSPKPSTPAHSTANATSPPSVAATTAAAPTPPPATTSASPTTTAATPTSTAVSNPVPTPVPPSSVPTSAALNKPSAPVKSGASGSASVPLAPSVSAATSSSSRVELALDTVEVQPGALTAQVVVHRRGSLRGDAPFSWWTEVGTAKPGADFTSVAPRTGLFADGSPNATLTITLSGAPHAREKSFYVVIDQKEGGATVSGRTLSQVTLLNNK